MEGVLALLEARLPWWTHDASFLEQTLIDSPWADPELPSLVAVDDEGGHPRIHRLSGATAEARRPRASRDLLRALTVSSDPKAGPAGALLLRRLLSGDQDLTWTDSPTEGVVRMWRAFGGHLDQPRSWDWMLVLRPFRWARGVLTARDAPRRGAGGRARGRASGPGLGGPVRSRGRSPTSRRR